MAVEALEVQGVRDGVRARRALLLRALLRPARGRLRPLGPGRRRRPSGGSRPAPTGSGATPTSCRSTGQARGDPLEPGLTPLVQADRLAERLGLAPRSGSRTTPPTRPTPSRTGSSPSPSPRRKELGFDDRRLRLDRQPRQRGRRPRRRRRPRVLRLRPGRPRGAEAARDRHLRHQPGRRPAATTTTSTGSAPSSPRRSPGPSSTSTCAPTTPRARRRSPSRRSSSSAGSCPTGSSARSPRARSSPSSGRGFQDWIDLGLVEGELPTFNGAQADGLLPGRDRLRRGLGRLQAAEARTRSPRASRSATRPTAPTRSSSPARPAAAIELGHRRRDPRRDQAARRDHRDLHRDRRRRHRSASCAKLAERGEFDARREGRRLHHRRGPEDARRRPATSSRCTRSIRPSTASRPSSPPARTPSRIRADGVTVKIPTQLRAATGGEAEVEVEGGTVGEALDAVFDAARRPARADHPGRRPAPLRQRLRLRRGHPLPARPRDRGQRRRRGHDPPGGSRAGERVKPPVVDPLRRARDPAARADRVGPEGAGRDRRPADPLARDPDLRRPGLRPLPAR